MRKRKAKKKLKGRERRLNRAPGWVGKHRGKSANMLKRYRKYFGVDWECAVAELTALGVEFDVLYLTRLRESVARHSPTEKKHVPITRWEFDQYHGRTPESDGTFAYIAGYTTGGLPFGVTWEEMETEDFENALDE